MLSSLSSTGKSGSIMSLGLRFVLPAIALPALLVAFVHASPPSPHIVFVIADDMGYNDVGYHSVGSAIDTPRLDALAAKGVKLENYYVSPMCSPTRSQLLTGLYTIHNEMTHVLKGREAHCLPPNNDTLANKLTDAGYATHLVGKWHLGFYKQACWPTNRGFQSFFGQLGGRGDHYTHSLTDFGNGQGECGHDFSGMDFRDNEVNVQPQYDGEYSTTIFTERAQRIVRDHDPDTPLFLLVTYTAPHTPFQAPEEYTARYQDRISNADRRTYAGMVTYLDESVGNLTQTLKQEGLWKDTVFIFMSDNGGAAGMNAGNNWPLRGGKGTYFDGGIRAIGFVTSPLLSCCVRGTSNHDLIYATDWFPTLLEGVAKLKLNGADLGIDGVNVWDIIRKGRPGNPDREIVYSIDPSAPRTAVDPKYDNHSLIFDVSIQAAIRRGHMKLLTGFQNRRSSDWYAPIESAGTYSFKRADEASKLIWLFNITADPNEENDLSDSMVDEVYDLLGRLNAYYTSSRFAPSIPMDKECASDPALHGGVWTNWE